MQQRPLQIICIRISKRSTRQSLSIASLNFLNSTKKTFIEAIGIVRPTDQIGASNRTLQLTYNLSQLTMTILYEMYSHKTRVRTTKQSAASVDRPL